MSLYPGAVPIVRKNFVLSDDVHVNVVGSVNVAPQAGPVSAAVPP